VIFSIPAARFVPLFAVFSEAFLLLALSRLALLFLPFRLIASFLDRPMARPQLPWQERARQRKAIQWAIDRAARCLPGETVCFPRGLAAFVMCRARGIDSVLHYGAAVVPGKGLKAHVWLLDGEYGITGHSVAAEYCLLARFPSSGERALHG
jgi:hypothetical protein